MFRCTIVGITEAQMPTIGRALGAVLQTGDVVALHGDLGAGKSTLSRSIIQSLCGADTKVPSPTFTLVETYTVHKNMSIWHMDWYRLSHPDEIWELGVQEAFSEGISLIEWATKAEGYLPLNTLHITLEDTNTATRDIHIQGEGWDLSLIHI